MTADDRPRGQPLLVFAVILGAWLVARVLLWAPPFELAVRPGATIAQSLGVQPRSLSAKNPSAQSGWTMEREGNDVAFADRQAGPVSPRLLSRWPVVVPGRAAPLSLGSAARGAAGHQMLLAAAFAHGTTLGDIAGPQHRAQQAPVALAAATAADHPLLGPPRERAESAASRLSGDAWLYWRDGSAVAVAPGVSSYGRSQAGAVMRYRLLPRHSLQPAAYLRLTRTLEGSRQEEMAAGVSVRPLRQVPATIAAEARVTDSAAGREIRPAIFVVTQISTPSLPFETRGEVYLQAGYVGGRFRTGFADGQARVDRRMLKFGETGDIRLGLGAWGGAQRGAARLDVGPTAAIAFRLGDASARVAADYRFRVAGDAAPASGPAVTFSAGF